MLITQVAQLRRLLHSDRTLFGHSLTSVREMLTTMDADGNGQVDYREFRRVSSMRSLAVSADQRKALAGGDD